MGLPGPASRLLEDFSTFEELPVPMSLLSCDGRVLRANEALCRLLGRSEPDLLAADAMTLFRPGDRPEVARVLGELVGGEVDTCERVTPFLRPDGSRTDVLLHCEAVRDAHGTVALLVQHAVPRGDGDGAALATAVRRSHALVRLAGTLRTEHGRGTGVAQAAAEALHAVVGGGASVFFVHPDDPTVLEAAAVCTGNPASEEELRRLYAQAPLSTRSGVFGRGARAGGPLVVENPWGTGFPGTALRDYQSWLSAHPVRWVLLVPLEWEGRVLGLLAVGRHAAEGFDEVQLAYASAVARLVSTVLADVQLLALERATVRREQAVARVVRRCEEALGEPTRVLDAAVRAVAAELDAACAGWVVARDGDPSGQPWTAVAHPDAAVEDAVRPLLPAWFAEGGPFLRQVLEEGRCAVVGRAHVAGQAVQTDAGRAAAAVLSVESVYGVRLDARGQRIGALVVGSPQRRLTVTDRRVVDALAGRVALALDNAALLEQARATRSRAEALVEHCSDLLMMAGRDGIITYAAPAAARIFGSSGVGRRLLSSVVPEDRPLVAGAWLRIVDTPGLSAPVDVRIVDAAGRLRRLSCVANNLLDDPAVDGVVLTVRDVTEERESSERLAERSAQQAALAALGATALTAAPDELFRTAAKLVAETLEPTTTGVLQWLPDERQWLVLGGSSARYLGARLGTGAVLDEVLRTGRPVLVDDFAGPDAPPSPALAEHGLRSGVVLPVLVEGRPWGAVTAHSDLPGRFTAVDVDFMQTVAAVISGAVERALMSERVLAQATTDALTGLPNRVVLQSTLLEQLRSGEPVALLLLDVDDFKDVNDSLGHGVGDDVLVQMARRLADVVGDRGRLGRLGGDEFAVVLRGADAGQDAAALADDLVRGAREPFALRGIDVTLSASVGIALAPRHGTDRELLMQAADLAMYRAKRDRSAWAVFDPDVDGPRAERLTLLSELRVALSSAQLLLHYQPLVDVRTERVVSVEALVRWQHPDRGLLLPAAFLPTAEQTDLVHGLTRYVVRSAARQARSWRVQGWAGTVAVNVSALALRSPEVVDQLRDELLRSEGALTVELTESDLADDRAREAITTFAEAGIACAVDDFGTGWSSLAYLRTLPVTRLKLDRAFNRDVDHDSRDAALVRGVVDMAHALDLDVVAEGVETPQVAARLRELGVDLAQGWHYGRPRPAASLRLQ